MQKIEELLEAAKRRSALSGLNDDTTLEPVLAAIYLGISTKKLEEMRLISRGAATAVGPPFIKMVDARSTGRNQAVFYKLGDLRAYQQGLKVSSSFEAALKSGLGIWELQPQTFYIRPEPSGKESIVVATNDFETLAERESHFSQFWSGELRVRGCNLKKSLRMTWTDPRKRTNAINAWKTLLTKELAEIEELQEAAPN